MCLSRVSWGLCRAWLFKFHLTALNLYFCFITSRINVTWIKGKVPPPQFINLPWLTCIPQSSYPSSPSLPQYCCPCVCLCWISPCSFLSFGFLVLFCFCPVIQFESTRSSSPTECCRFSPWSRKVVVPPSLLAPVCSLWGFISQLLTCSSLFDSF